MIKCYQELSEVIQKIITEVEYEKDMIKFHNAQITTYQNMLSLLENIKKCSCGGVK